LIDADEEEFGEERLEALVLQNISLPPQDLTELIVDTACDFAGEAGAVDDETIVVIRCLGAGA
jgi:serine phosphatase RsbU (regulator of sigma subunit)